ncbi:tellurite resistance TerB family protein [Ferrimonas balearica]|uniref:tellurite resistance TerB family protein n=1 Tax=Ferrimonas balearica TaxID=44012 RepID=UPI001C993F65|nr:tellurite resistance TerB family protein [Ferrimonas balearica]MBY5991988.1 tellurite resistance TerB family protein [Ferrimonas balearica]
MADVNKLLGSLLGSSAAKGFAGGLAGGVAGNLLMSKSGRKMGKKALKVGGIAAVGALAYTAYQRYSNSASANGAEAPQGGHASGANAATTPSPYPNESAALSQQRGELIPAPEGSAFLPAENDAAANEALGMTLIRAMIAAARCDGRLDAQESQAIFQRIEMLELDPASKNLLIQEMGQPVDMDAIVNSATCPEVAAEIYAASVLAIDVDTTAERAYLGMLAARLQLPPGLANELEAEIQAQRA